MLTNDRRNSVCLALALALTSVSCGTASEIRDQTLAREPEPSGCGTIAFGETHQGTLTASAPTVMLDGRPRHALHERLCLDAGESVTVVMCTTIPSSAAHWDSYLLLGLNGMLVAHDDDSAGGLQSRMLYTATTSATYDLYLGSFTGEAPPAPGSYTVRVLEGAHPEASCP